jgi:hypothetical protein
MRDAVDPIEIYLSAASVLLDLPIRPEDRDEVLAAFVVLTAQAKLVTEFALPEAILAAPRFVP